jgi:hypothetical protein
MLCEISTASNATHGVLLSAIVVHQDDHLPGDGFFTFAESPGRTVGLPAEFHEAELARVHMHYGAGPA